MALEFKSSKTFKFVIGTSALFISTIAATFSVTGVASLFSGYFFTVALMMGGLEFGKVVLASFLARYWKKISVLFKTYFIVALTTLVLITSAGIFGYLSDGYQKTKGIYDVNEKEVVFIKQKVDLFTKQKETIDSRIQTLSNARSGQERRLDSLYARRQNSTAKSVEAYISKSNTQLDDLTKQSATISDSISKYTLNQLNKEKDNSVSELGPLKYLATIFNTDMDTIVKYFIFALIFVFDPLAILLFVSLNIIIKNESEGDFQERTPSDVKGKFKKLFSEMKFWNKKPEIVDTIEEIKEPIVEEQKIEDVVIPTNDVVAEVEIKKEIIEEPILIEKTSPIIENSENIESDVEKIQDEIKEVEANEIPKEIVNKDTEKKEHEFYYGEDPKLTGFHTPNFSIERVLGKKEKKQDDENTKTY